MTRSTHYRKSIVHKTIYVDQETGEQLATDVKVHGYMTKDKESFYLMYSSLLGLMQFEMGLPEIRVYAYLIEHYSTGTLFAINGPLKRIIGSRLELAIKTVDNTLTRLKSKKLLFSTESTMYMINPRYAFQGSSAARQSSMKAIIELGFKDC